MTLKTIDEYFSERKLKFGSIVYIDGIEHMIIQTGASTVGLVDLVSHCLICGTTMPHDVPFGYVSRSTVYMLAYRDSIVHIGVGDESVPIDEYFGERKLPIGSLVILDGVSHRLVLGYSGASVLLVNTDTWESFNRIVSMSGAYNDGVDKITFATLSRPLDNSVLIEDTNDCS